jgi:hypothetical protein
LHPLLLAGLPAHLCKNSITVRFRGYQNPSRPRNNRIQRVLRGRRCRHVVSQGVFTQPRPTPADASRSLNGGSPFRGSAISRKHEERRKGRGSHPIVADLAWR